MPAPAAVPTDAVLLDAWEAGAGMTPAARALVLLREVGGHPAPEATGVGRRDAALLDLHTSLFGNQLAATTDCPRCGEPLDVPVDAGVINGSINSSINRAIADGVPGGSAREQVTDEIVIEVGDHVVHARLPTAGELAALPAGEPTDRLAARLLERCVTAASCAGVAVEPAQLPADLRAPVEDRLQEVGGEVELVLTCPSCGHRWTGILDPAAFLWVEIDVRARQLADDVHVLASAYGWSEAEILALSRRRRALYLEAVLA